MSEIIEGFDEPANLFVEFIGAKLEKVHRVPVNRTGYKSITLCFNNGKTVCYEYGLSAVQK